MQKPAIHAVRDFIASAEIAVWNKARPKNSPLSAAEYRDVWRVLSGTEE
jgi:hypothetical protein